MNTNKDFTLKRLTKEDLFPELLNHFNRYQEVVKVWRIVDGKKILQDEPFIDDWDEELKREVVEQDITNSINSGGEVFGVFYDGKLIAFSNLYNGFFGSANQYILLGQLHVSLEFRKLGIGKLLFEKSVLTAKEWGAKKLYISGHSAEETQKFYKSLGCVDAEEINQKIHEHEPFDCQLEYVIKWKQIQSG